MAADSVLAPGTVKVLHGEGMPIRKQQSEKADAEEDQRTHGDLFILFEVEFPTKLSLDQKT